MLVYQRVHCYTFTAILCYNILPKTTTCVLVVSFLMHMCCCGLPHVGLPLVWDQFCCFPLDHVVFSLCHGWILTTAHEGISPTSSCCYYILSYWIWSCDLHFLVRIYPWHWSSIVEELQAFANTFLELALCLWSRIHEYAAAGSSVSSCRRPCCFGEIG